MTNPNSASCGSFGFGMALLGKSRLKEIEAARELLEKSRLGSTPDQPPKLSQKLVLHREECRQSWVSWRGLEDGEG